ncbi:hypothetical protein [Gordonia sp. (in: high G+C Gram-positive bacteria)]|uniref:hypothetical protein n=1 Tax=Gordonia sp. (in: high G+C Gram-positive bacteria) TaxID=84139 RepID=UPI0039E2175B
MSTPKCATCGQTVKRTAAHKRANRAAHNSDFEIGACRTCNAPILIGWTEGILAILDGRPLNEIGEMAAAALGLSTYLRRELRFRRRDQFHRRGPFPERPETVHAEHRCGQDWPEQLRLPLAGHENPQPNTPTTEHDQPNY